MHDPDEELSAATRAHLSTLEAFDRLGSGLAISARDLDLRGWGDLTGEDQAGHMRMVGAALYHRLLDRAIRAATSEGADDVAPPHIQLGERGAIPGDDVPDAVTRINLYGRLARLTKIEDLDDLGDELQDRFGPLPPALASLLDQARLGVLAREAGITEVIAGPRGVALTLAKPLPNIRLKPVGAVSPESKLKGERLIVPLEPMMWPTASR